MEWLMQWLAKVLDFVIGCQHHNLSRVFTINKRTYRICCDCGAEFSYSLANMAIERRTPAPQLRRLRHAQTS